METSNTNNSKTEKLEEFKYEFKEFSDDNEEYDEYEKTLEKDIENNCDLNVYVNKLELEEKSDSELLKMEKHEIIDFKNYQIQKLKAYIVSLEKEKEDLIEQYANTTSLLLEKIKESEFRNSGVRPDTPHIANKLKAKNLQNNSNNTNTSNNSNNNIHTIKKGNSNNEMNIMNSTVENMNLILDNGEDSKINYDEVNSNSNKIQRCPNCTKEFPGDLFLQHSLDCLRNKIRCKKCNELIEDKNKKQHLEEWRTKEKIVQAIESVNKKMLQQCLDHGASVNKILDEETGDCKLHYILLIIILFFNFFNFSDFTYSYKALSF